MLVNHVTEKTNPLKFAARHIRQQVIAIQDPYVPKIAAAREAYRNAKNYFEVVDLGTEYHDLLREAAGEEPYMGDMLSDEEAARRDTLSAINSLRNDISTIVAEVVSKAIGKS